MVIDTIFLCYCEENNMGDAVDGHMPSTTSEELQVVFSCSKWVAFIICFAYATSILRYGWFVAIIMTDVFCYFGF